MSARITTTTRAIPVLMSLLLTAHASTTNRNYRKLPCKTPALASSCIHIHGRLWQGNGSPSTRLWQIGTHHIFGIYTNQYGFIHDPETTDNEAPSLPENIQRERDRQPKGFPYLQDIYADFDVCPLEPHIQGNMQAACIDSATHLFSPKE